MNFKKFISGVSALTIAASAFAGMAVTANAADVEVDYIGSSTAAETYDGYTATNWTAVNNTTNLTFASNATANEHFGIVNITNVAAPAMGEVYDTTVTGGPTYVDGSTLHLQTRGDYNNTATATYTFPEAVTSGKLHFETDFFVDGRHGNQVPNNNKVVFYDSDGNEIVAAGKPGTNSYFRYATTSDGLSGSRRTEEMLVSGGYVGLHFAIDFDMTAKTFTINADYIKKDGTRAEVTTTQWDRAVTPTAFTATDIASFAFSVQGRNKNINYGTAIDNTKLYNVVEGYAVNPVDSATATVSVDKTAALAGATVTATATAKEGYLDPVISVKDANDNDVAVDANGQFTMPASDVTVTATASTPAAVNSVKVKYQLSDGTEIVTEDVAKVLNSSDNGFINVADLTVGDTATVPFRMYVEKDGKLYQTTANSNSNGNYLQKNVTLTLDTVVTKTVTEVNLGGTLVLFDDLDDTAAQNAGIRASNGSAYDNKAYTSSTNLAPGVYKFILRTQNKGRASSVKVGDTTIWKASSVGSGSWANREISNITVTEAAPITLVQGEYESNGKTVRAIDDYDVIIAIKTADLYSISKAATTNGSFEVASTATAGTNVTITPSAASGYEVDTVTVKDSANNDVTVTNNSFTMPASDVTVSVTFKAVTPAGPSAEVTGISYKQFAKTSASDKDVTAAKVYVTVTGSIDTLGLKYYDADTETWTNAKYAKDITKITTDGDTDIVLGAIVPGLVELSTSSFDAVIE